MATAKGRSVNDYTERTLALNEAAKHLADSLLGCWQHELSRPFTCNGTTYRACLKCGMMRDLHLKPGRPAVKEVRHRKTQIYLAA
jgi:hypothetical protein